MKKWSTLGTVGTALAAVSAAMIACASSATADPGSFSITSEVPTLDQLEQQVHFLTATPASDEAKAANLEGGMNAVVVPRTVYNLGLFREPLGWSEVTGPQTHEGDVHTAILHSNSAGRPAITMKVTWKRVDGAWKLANSSLCDGVQAVGLPIACDF
ncbi:hypothetical protein [Nocardia shimofusensis]|uniref:hypothetical protein n=1 Tax=Nocardia shimofusensis TaxID=228596 RepID=UPI00082BAA00|nr:hypothetical protein [Nocardia shimofusensis]